MSKGIDRAISAELLHALMPMGHGDDEAAKEAFVIVRTADPGPCGCFVVRNGVI